MNKDDKFLFNINGKNFFGINNIPDKYTESVNKLIKNTEETVDFDYIKIIRDSFIDSNGNNVNIKVYTKKGRRVFCIKDTNLVKSDYENRYKNRNVNYKEEYDYNAKMEKLIYWNLSSKQKKKREILINIFLLFFFYIIRFSYVIFNYYQNNPTEFQKILDLVR